MSDPSVRRLRALFLSDIHLGSRACRSDALLDFLARHDADTVYLVGDIVDGWRLSSNWYWPPAHNDVLMSLLGLAQRGRRVIYVPGNHDEFLRDYCGTHFGGVEVAPSAVHASADGRRYLVVHGDHFDRMIKRTRRLASLGHRANMAALGLSASVNRVRRQFGLRDVPLSQWVKLHFKRQTSYLADFERALAEFARGENVDGVICGHVHHAVMHDEFGIHYVNCGDWIESCTAVGENEAGAFEILSWNGSGPRESAPPMAQARAA